MDEIGPLQLLVIGSEDPKLDGSVFGSLMDASDSGVIRVVDALGVYKDADGDIIAAEMTDLDMDEAMVYGAWVGTPCPRPGRVLALASVWVPAAKKVLRSAPLPGPSRPWTSTSTGSTRKPSRASQRTFLPEAQLFSW